MAELVPVRSCDDPERRGDVVFVHGLNGNARAYWFPQGEPEKFWPAWLGEDVADVGVWSLGYENAALKPRRIISLARLALQGGFAMPLLDRAKNVLLELVQKRIGERPLVFIAHSMGGLLVKQVLRATNDSTDPKWRAILDQTRGVCFIATPHIGADPAKWMSYFKTLLGTNVSVDDLQPHQPYLRDLNDWYRDYVTRGNVSIKTLWFYETKPMPVVGLIVAPGDANPMVPHAGCYPLDEDHVSICKPKSKESPIHRGVLDFIRHDCLRLDAVDFQLKEVVLPEKPQASPVPTSVSNEMPRMGASERTRPIPPDVIVRTKVFISYCHKDREWLDRLRVHLTPLVREGTIDSWDDTRIRASQNWREEIDKALNQAAVAVLLITADFLASEFIDKNELPPILAAARDRKLMIFSVIISPSRFDQTPSLSQFQAINPVSRPLNRMRKPGQEAVWVELTKEIESALKIHDIPRTGPVLPPLRPIQPEPTSQIDADGGVPADHAVPTVPDSSMRHQEHRDCIRALLVGCLERLGRTEGQGAPLLFRVAGTLEINDFPDDQARQIQKVADLLVDPARIASIPRLNSLVVALRRERLFGPADLIDECMGLILPLHFPREAIDLAAHQLKSAAHAVIQGTVTTELGAEIVWAALDQQSIRVREDDPRHRGEYSVSPDSPALGKLAIDADVWAVIEDVVVKGGLSLDQQPSERGRPIDEKRKTQLLNDLKALEWHKLSTSRTFYCVVREPDNPANRDHAVRLYEEVRKLVPLLPIVMLDSNALARGDEAKILGILRRRRAEAQNPQR